ncbi:MAG: biopolymer transporter ExbD [Bdellovibrionaceae bacterium]|nr:biopolymer transporter ExbD [Pseudobdellovibrionaceae bacterium]
MEVQSSNDGQGIVGINIVPLVDIILVVLIIFMVAAPLVMNPKIDITLPSSSAKDIPKDAKPMKVTLGKAGELFVNNKAATLSDLLEESKKRAATNPDTGVILIADKGATLEMITELVDSIKSGGLKKVAFSIQKK